MGTRGAYGFHKDGVDKITYNHWDSYPSGLGQNVVDFINETSVDEMNSIFDKIILVDAEAIPTNEQIENCRMWKDLGVSNQSENDWYCLLRNSQGDLNAYKNGLIYMKDDADFIKDSLFCEWAYVINLDNNTLEVYEGFQQNPQENRYYSVKSTNYSDGYYNCALVATFDLDDIPDNWIDLVEPEDEE